MKENILPSGFAGTTGTGGGAGAGVGTGFGFLQEAIAKHAIKNIKERFFIFGYIWFGGLCLLSMIMILNNNGYRCLQERAVCAEPTTLRRPLLNRSCTLGK